jgi:tRNA-uridine 2-sulfurtransferase
MALYPVHMKKGIHLYSGGLDSVVSAKLLLDQGIELIGLHFVLPFISPTIDPRTFTSSRRAEAIGLPLRFERCGAEYMKMAQNPPHGFGSHMNPCIDCKIFFLRRAAEIMREVGASFVSTGEVIGQRPMSQKKDMLNHILKESGLEGRLLRPLSALKLKPTIAEDEGIVDRSRLLDISGRGRYRQMSLAEQWGITDYAAPAGGCLFTDPNVARRIKDLYEHTASYTLDDVYLLSLGRHFRMNDSMKFIVPRNEEETLEIESYAAKADLFIRPDFAGPCLFVRGKFREEDIAFLVSVIVRYGKPGKNGTNDLHVITSDGRQAVYSADTAADDSQLERMRI